MMRRTLGGAPLEFGSQRVRGLTWPFSCSDFPIPDSHLLISGFYPRNALTFQRFTNPLRPLHPARCMFLASLSYSKHTT